MLDGKKGLVLGVANKRSLAWACARSCAERGARIGLTYQGERFADTARQLAGSLPSKDGAEPLTLQCDVTKDAEIASLASAVRETWGGLDFVVHSIAFASPEELKNRFLNTSRPGFQYALDVSSYSLLALAR